jgi:hypothetical protein
MTALRASCHKESPSRPIERYELYFESQAALGLLVSK